MYNLDINFLKDRQLSEEIAKATLTGKKAAEPTQNKLPIYIGAGTLIALPIIALGLLLVNNQQKGEIESQIRDLDGKIAQLQAQNSEVAQLEEQLAETRANRQALVSVFNQIKPVSVILQDISDQTPPGIQIESIQQTEVPSEVISALPVVNLTITGFARSFNDVNDFLLILQESDFLDRNNTHIQSTAKIANPNPLEYANEQDSDLEVSLPEVVRFTINTQINQVPASELIPQLTQKGATGLVTRINTLKQKGAIEP